MTPETAEQIATAIAKQRNNGFTLTSCEPVFGGDINHSYVLRNRDSAYFVKTNSTAHLPMLEAEAASLYVLKEAAALKVPKPVTLGQTAECAYLVLEYHPMQGSGNSRSLAQGLVTLHQKTSPNGRFGWDHDNFIGTSPQRNRWHNQWDSFWWEERLEPQLEMAYEAGHAAVLQPLACQLKERLPEIWRGHAPVPSLLHGDLWSGNASYLNAGEPVIYDPASYYGDRETDLAMTELFGGFAPEFYDEYARLWPLTEGYPQRKKLYNLYHLLNHLSLFGSAYLSQCRNTLKQLTT